MKNGAGRVQVLAIIQARMSSNRLPGKALRSIAGKPLLRWVYDRLTNSSELSRVVVATSEALSDNPIHEYCIQHDISVHRGPLNNVAKRLVDCARDQEADEFVRISGDSPLIDPALVDQGIALQKATSCDLSTNVQFRSFPKGQSVEVIRTESLARAMARMRQPEDFEHVTRYLYAHPDDFAIKNFSSDDAMGHLQLSVDSVEDFEMVSMVLNRLGDFFSWRDAVEVIRGVPR